MKNQQNDSCFSEKELMYSSDPQFLPEILFQNIDFFFLATGLFFELKRKINNSVVVFSPLDEFRRA